MAFPKSFFESSLWRRVVLTPLRQLVAMRWRYRMLLLAMLVAVGFPGYLAWKRERNNNREQLTSDVRRRLDRALSINDANAAETLLVQLVELTRHDPAVEKRLDALRRGEADQNDAPLARLLLNDHLNHSRWTDANREATKVIDGDPADMLARAVLARQALRDGRIHVARSHLAAIPSPNERPDAATPGALLLEVSLKRELGDDDTELLSFIASRLTPLLKSRQSDRLPPQARLQLVQCYHLACDALERYPDLASYWAPAARLIAELGAKDAGPQAAAQLRERHLEVIYRLRKMNCLSDDEISILIGQTERQVRDCWMEAHASDLHEPLPYAGLALAEVRAGRPDEARQWLKSGLKECSNSRELYLIFGRLTRVSDPRAGAAFLEQAYERFPTDAAIQQSLAESAAAAGRPDRALEVCRIARSKKSDSAWACRLEAAICLEMNRPTQALEALASLKSSLPRDEGGMELYVRAACAIGAAASLAELLAAPPREMALANGHAGAARGYLKGGRYEDAIRVAGLIIEQFPEHADARATLAEGLRLRAEAGDAAHWHAERVQEAIEAFDWLRRRDPANCVIAQRIAWLQLKGLDAPGLAVRTAAPLRQRATVDYLTPEMGETLGTALAAAGEAEEAIQALTRAIDAAPRRAGPYISRATALLQLGRKLEAQADLDHAECLPLTPRQMAEWRQATAKLRGEK